MADDREHQKANLRRPSFFQRISEREGATVYHAYEKHYESSSLVATSYPPPDDRYGQSWIQEAAVQRRADNSSEWDQSRAGYADELHSGAEGWDSIDPGSHHKGSASACEVEYITIDSSEDEDMIEASEQLHLTVVRNTNVKVLRSRTISTIEVPSEATTRVPFMPSSPFALSRLHGAGSRVASANAEKPQPSGDRCIVICRLSSWSSARKFYTGDASLNAAGRARLVADLRAEGLILAGRLQANCAHPKRFIDIEATVHKTKSDDFINYGKNSGTIPDMVIDIRRWFDSVPKRSKVTALIRAVDGLTIDEATLKSFLKMATDRKIEIELMFQYNKVYNDIRPLKLQAFRGLGSVLVLSGEECLSHFQDSGGQRSADVQRLLDIWKWLRASKNNAQGIQDRNILPDENHTTAVEGTAGQKMKVRKGTGPTGVRKFKESTRAKATIKKRKFED